MGNKLHSPTIPKRRATSQTNPMTTPVYCLESVQATAGREAHAEPRNLSELRIQRWEWRQAKATVSLGAQSLREESCTKRELWRSDNICLESSAQCRSVHTYEETTQGRGQSYGSEQTRNNLKFSLARVARHCYAWGTGDSTQKPQCGGN